MTLEGRICPGGFAFWCAPAGGMAATAGRCHDGRVVPEPLRASGGWRDYSGQSEDAG